MENSKICCTPIPEHECKQKQDCECVRCIDIEINQFNPKKSSRRLPRLSIISRPIDNRQKKKDEIHNINIKLEQKELNQLPIYKDYFYKDIEEEMDDWMIISEFLKRKDQQLKELKQEIKDLQDRVRDYQQIRDIKKDINKLKNDMKELQEFNNIIIQNEINDQAKQFQINRLNKQTKELKQREQIKKLKED